MKKLLLSLLLLIFGVSIYSVNAAIVINEMMANPDAVSDTDGEWFEVYNTDYYDINIDGWIISDNGSNDHTIDNDGELIVPAKGYIVLGKNANYSENGGVDIDYEYSNFILSNTEDEVILSNNSTIIDIVEYDSSFPSEDGKSIELINPSMDNNFDDSWNISEDQYGQGDYGTPGMRNSIYEGPDYKCRYARGTGNFKVEGPGNITIEGTGEIRVKDYETLNYSGNWTIDNIGEWTILTGTGWMFAESWETGLDDIELKGAGEGYVDARGYGRIRLRGFGVKLEGCD